MTDVMPSEPVEQVRPPWSGLGGSVKKGSSVSEMLKKNRLNWTVKTGSLFYGEKSDKDQLRSHRVLLKSTGGPPLGICGPSYVPVQNQTAFTFFNEYCSSVGMEITDVGCFGDGKMPWALANIQKSFILKGKDRVDGYVLLFNPHVWGKSFTVKFTTIRVVCLNTLVMALREDVGARGFSFPHIKEFGDEDRKSAKLVMQTSLKLLETQKAAAETLSETVIDDSLLVKYVGWAFKEPSIMDVAGNEDNLTSAKALAKGSFKPTAMEFEKRSSLEALDMARRSPGADLPSSKDTLWGALNGITYYVDHRAGRRRDLALEKAWTGDLAALKISAVNKGLALAAALA